jgi:hypothetical protein
VDVVGVAGGSLLVLMFEAPIPFILISGLHYIYINIKCFNTTVASGHMDVTPN